MGRAWSPILSDLGPVEGGTRLRLLLEDGLQLRLPGRHRRQGCRQVLSLLYDMSCRAVCVGHDG